MDSFVNVKGVPEVKTMAVRNITQDTDDSDVEKRVKSVG